MLQFYIAEDAQDSTRFNTENYVQDKEIATCL